MSSEPRLIGVSLPLCIHQIATGAVKESDVRKIVSACTSEAFLSWVIPNYPKSYWRDLPEKCVEIAQRLKEKGSIEFPRDADENHFPIMPDMICWVESPDEIVWFDR